ncbi:hypothetical protein [Brevundimonas sp.]|uniref:baeRF11 domain-containing protein n=1 Tax=Brevundimonas sp. TaxID=1871086 RepID=UPI001DF0E02F|nr:hypothetical protein [Brevundimonas sp.]MBL0947848.1 hypothetical protein [Brevundimonas sp.]
MLHVDIPTAGNFANLSALRADFCISIYLEATPLSQDSDSTRIALKSAVRQARQQLEQGGFDPDRREAALARIEALDGNYNFWRLQANSLAVLATADGLHVFRLANRLKATVQVADRFHLKPLLRAITFSHHAYVLALSQKAVRLVELFADLPAVEVSVDGLPPPSADAVDKSTPEGRDNDDSIHNAEHQNRLLEKYAAEIDAVLGPVLKEKEAPLILAATGRLAPVYRAANSYSRLLPHGIEHSPDRISAAELAQAARPILEIWHQTQMGEIRELYDSRAGQSRTTTDLSDAARAATFGAIEILIVDLDIEKHGTINEETGAISFAEAATASSYDIVDEIAGRALATGARVLAARATDIPGGSGLAAILRYPM